MVYISSEYSLLDKNGQRKYLNQKERDRFYQTIKLEIPDVKLFCEILFWTGGRISEVLNLKKESIDFSERVVIFESLKKRKKGIYRQVPLPPYLLSELLVKTQKLNCSSKLWSYSRRTASRYIKRIMLKASVTGPMSCSKGLRHSFAIHCLVKNIPITLIKKWLGHASLATTSIYLDVANEEERKISGNRVPNISKQNILMSILMLLSNSWIQT